MEIKSKNQTTGQRDVLKLKTENCARASTECLYHRMNGIELILRSKRCKKWKIKFNYDALQTTTATRFEHIL